MKVRDDRRAGDPVPAARPYSPCLAGLLLGIGLNGEPLDLAVFQKVGIIGISGIALAIVLSYFIRETGTALIHRKAGDGSLVKTVSVIGSVK